MRERALDVLCLMLEARDSASFQNSVADIMVTCLASGSPNLDNVRAHATINRLWHVMDKRFGNKPAHHIDAPLHALFLFVLSMDL